MTTAAIISLAFTATLAAIVIWAVRAGHESNVPTDAELAWAEDWCAEHVDPWLPDLPAPVEGEDFVLWESEVREGSL